MADKILLSPKELDSDKVLLDPGNLDVDSVVKSRNVIPLVTNKPQNASNNNTVKVGSPEIELPEEQFKINKPGYVTNLVSSQPTQNQQNIKKIYSPEIELPQEQITVKPSYVTQLLNPNPQKQEQSKQTFNPSIELPQESQLNIRQKTNRYVTTLVGNTKEKVPFDSTKHVGAASIDLPQELVPQSFNLPEQALPKIFTLPKTDTKEAISVTHTSTDSLDKFSPLLSNPNPSGNKIIVSIPDRLMLLQDKDNNVIREYKVYIGKKGSETPQGQFRIMENIKPGPSEWYYANHWLGFAQGYKKEKDSIPYAGFHGWVYDKDDDAMEQTEPGWKTSTHGCVQMDNRDIDEFSKLVGVGDPVTIINRSYNPPPPRIPLPAILTRKPN